MVVSSIAHNILWLCVCYFGLPTLAFKDKFYSQNNSTKPLLAAAAVNLVVT
jgi:hypothetical protein